MIFQVWDRDADGERYDFSMYFVREAGDTSRLRPDVLVSRGRYYAIDTDTLTVLMEEAGFRRVERIDDVYFQPVLFAHNPAE